MFKYLWNHFSRRVIHNNEGFWGPVIGGALSLAGSMLGNKSSSGGTGAGYDVVTLPQYSWTEPRRRMVSDYLANNMQRLSQGLAPQWYSRLAPQVEEGMRRSNYQTYFGRPGQRTGLMQAATEAGAMGGVGPKALMAQTGRVGQEYADKERAISEYLASQEMNMMNQQSLSIPAMLSGQPFGPESQIVSMPGTAPTGGGLMNTFSQLMGQVPWESMFNNNISVKYPSQNQLPAYQPLSSSVDFNNPW